jgi:putative transcriptional regulator
MSLLLVVIAAVRAAGQTAGPPHLRSVQFNNDVDKLRVGALLVSKPELNDPNFIHTVVVLVQYDQEKGAYGLIVNRRGTASLDQVLPKIKNASAHLVYEGGPVQTDLMQAMFRSRTKPDNSQPVVGDIFETANSDAIEKMAGASGPERFHAYIGYCGWSGGQLENEIEMGAWAVLKPDAGVVFDDDPDSLWQRLDRKTQMRIARVFAPIAPHDLPR